MSHTPKNRYNQMQKVENGTPRRIRIDLHTAAEMAIRNAMIEVEKAGGSIALTNCVRLLSEAQDCMADHYENIIHGSAVQITFPEPRAASVESNR